MHKVLFFGLSLLLVLGYTLSSIASEDIESTVLPPTPQIMGEGTVEASALSAPVTARAYLIMDATTGAVVASRSPEAVLPIASITKLVTAVAVKEAMLAEAKSPLADRIPHQNNLVSTYDILFELLLTSSNTAGEVLAMAEPNLLPTVIPAVLKRSVAPHTMEIVDTTGLSPANKASSQAIATFTRYVWQTFPELLDVTTLPRYIGAYDQFLNNNPVATMPGYRGGKHGYTDEAGRTITAVFDENTTIGVRPIIYVVLGSDNLVADMAVLRRSISQLPIETKETSAILPL